MKQVLHIFRKDARHYWRESVISIALMAAYAWYEIRNWGADGDMAYGVSAFGLFASGFLKGLVPALLPISWAFVIVRVIQGESLVGDRQFWVTRPYEWKELLAAKILFILAVVNLPLLIADVYLLSKAGFPPLHYVRGLLWMQLLIALFVLLTIAALATVTASLLQMGLAVLVIALYLIGMVSLSEQIPSSSFSSSIGDSLQTALLIGTCIAVILWQYSMRKTARSRGLIAGFAFILFLILVATPYRRVVAHDYPLEAERPPLQLALLPAEKPGDENISDKEDEVQIQIPLSVSRMSDDSLMTMSGVMVEIESPDGVRWNSGWRSPGTSLFPGQKRTQIDFSLKRKLFERVRGTPVVARISVALIVFHDRNRREFIVPNGEFAMPDVGLCTAEAGYSRNIRCRAALRTPSSLLITSDLSQTTCPARREEVRAQSGEIARDWHHYSDSGPAEFGISPVKTVNFYLAASSLSDPHAITGACLGTRLVLSNPEAVRSMRIEMVLSDLRLAAFQKPFISFWR